MEVLNGMESDWGGTPQQRMASRYRAFATQYGVNAPKPADEDEIQRQVQSTDAAAEGPRAPVTEAAAPPPEPEGDTAQAPKPTASAAQAPVDQATPQ